MKSMSPSTPDSVLVCRFADGDERAFTTLFNRYFNNTVQFITALSGGRDTAITPADIASEALFKVSEAIRTRHYSPNGKFAAYLAQTARNLFIDYTRRTKKAPIPQNRLANAETDDSKINLLFGLAPAPPDNTEYCVAKDKLIDLIHEEVDRLPDFQKTVIGERLKGFKFIDIASRHNAPTNTILGRHKDGVDKIRRRLTKHPVTQLYLTSLAED